MKRPLTPGLLAAKNNPDIVFMELDVKDTSPTVTQGFTDEQIKEMRTENLRAELQSCNSQEQLLREQMHDLSKRKFILNEILLRKAEL